MKLLKRSRIHLGIVFLSAFLPYATSQQGGTGGSAGNTGESGRRAAPQRPQYPPAQPDSQIGRPAAIMIFLSGRVALEDGSPPPFGAVIETDCGGAVSREEIIGLNGRFSFQAGGGGDFGQVFPDASRSFDSWADGFNASGRNNLAAPAGQTNAWRSKFHFDDSCDKEVVYTAIEQWSQN
jgi:hypothetical protein